MSEADSPKPGLAGVVDSLYGQDLFTLHSDVRQLMAQSSFALLAAESVKPVLAQALTDVLEVSINTAPTTEQDFLFVDETYRQEVQNGLAKRRIRICPTAYHPPLTTNLLQNARWVWRPEDMGLAARFPQIQELFRKTLSKAVQVGLRAIGKQGKDIVFFQHDLFNELVRYRSDPNGMSHRILKGIANPTFANEDARAAFTAYMSLAGSMHRETEVQMHARLKNPKEKSDVHRSLADVILESRALRGVFSDARWDFSFARAKSYEEYLAAYKSSPFHNLVSLMTFGIGPGSARCIAPSRSIVNLKMIHKRLAAMECSPDVFRDERSFSEDRVLRVYMFEPNEQELHTIYHGAFFTDHEYCDPRPDDEDQYPKNDFVGRCAEACRYLAMRRTGESDGATGRVYDGLICKHRSIRDIMSVKDAGVLQRLSAEEITGNLDEIVSTCTSWLDVRPSAQSNEACNDQLGHMIDELLLKREIENRGLQALQGRYDFKSKGAGGAWKGMVYRVAPREKRQDGVTDCALCIYSQVADIHAKTGIGETPPERVGALSNSNFMNELMMLRMIPKHPHLVHYVGYEIEPRHCVLTEWVEGKRLDEYDRRTVLELDPVKVVYQVASALRCLHNVSVSGVARPIVHADVKLSNIIVKASGDAVLLDLGNCDDLSENPENELRRPGSILYAAPEELERKVYLASDVWALGLVGMQLLDYYPFGDERSGLAFEKKFGNYADQDPMREAKRFGVVQRIKQYEIGNLIFNLDSPVETSYRRRPQWFTMLLAACVRPDYKTRPTIDTVCATIRQHRAELPQYGDK